MSIDESKMEVASSLSFLNLRKQHTNLELKLLFKIETHTTLTEQNRSTKTSYDQPIQIVNTSPRPSNSGRNYRLHKPTTDTQTQQNCLRN